MAGVTVDEESLPFRVRVQEIVSDSLIDVYALIFIVILTVAWSVYLIQRQGLQIERLNAKCEELSRQVTEQTAKRE
jgi:hypothetical protein